jgi:hypothetical protein
MSNLQALQDRMSSAIMAGSFAALSAEFRHSERLPIFTNNTYMSLTRALQTTFPVTAQLADERFFAYAAHEFIQRHPPREARLSQFGSAFPGFLKSFPPCRRYPIIAEMAAFEWAIASSLNDRELPIAPFAIMKNCIEAPSAGIQLQPNLRFPLSRLPLKRIWQDHKNDALSSSASSNSIHRFAIARRGESLQIFELDSARFVFWRMLSQGHCIQTASHRALLREPLFDIVHEVLLLFRIGLVTGVSIASSPN